MLEKLMELITPVHLSVDVYVWDRDKFHQVIERAAKQAGETTANIRYTAEIIYPSFFHPSCFTRIHIGCKDRNWRKRRDLWNELRFELKYY